jgi:two-component system response regulator NreC
MKKRTPPTTELEAIGTLSQREHEVFLALALGATNREIGQWLGTSVKTVDTHRGHVLQKTKSFGIRNNADLARLALRSGEIAQADRWTPDGGVVRGT